VNRYVHIVRNDDEELQVSPADAQALLDGLLVYSCLECQIGRPNGQVVYHLEPSLAHLRLLDLVELVRLPA
jgi:hypothetical protein